MLFIRASRQHERSPILSSLTTEVKGIKLSSALSSPAHEFQSTPGNQLDPDAEDDDIAMIPAMVALAQIMSEASHLLYHSPKRSVSERSRIAMALDRKLFDWKSNLPKCLNIDAASLNDTEWAFKQKLVLRLRESVFHHINRHF